MLDPHSVHDSFDSLNQNSCNSTSKELFNHWNISTNKFSPLSTPPCLLSTRGPSGLYLSRKSSRISFIFLFFYFSPHLIGIYFWNESSCHHLIFHHFIHVLHVNRCQKIDKLLVFSRCSRCSRLTAVFFSYSIEIYSWRRAQAILKDPLKIKVISPKIGCELAGGEQINRAAKSIQNKKVDRKWMDVNEGKIMKNKV